MKRVFTTQEAIDALRQAYNIPEQEVIEIERDAYNPYYYKFYDTKTVPLGTITLANSGKCSEGCTCSKLTHYVDVNNPTIVC